MNCIDTTSLVAQDITTPLLAATYTSDAARELLIVVGLSGVAGGGAYRACMTYQRGGVGAAYQSGTSAIVVSAGVTTVYLLTTPVAVQTDDVLAVWVQGLAADSSVDVVVDVFDVAIDIADIAGGTIAISATQAASVSTGALAIRTHHTLAQAITSTTTSDLSAATKLWLTVKSRRTDTDAQAVVFIEATAGLTVLAGAVYTTVEHGTLVVGGLAGAWTVTVGLDEVATSLLTDYAESMLWAECKALVAGATVAVWDGVCDVSHGLVVAVA